MGDLQGAMKAATEGMEHYSTRPGEPFSKPHRPEASHSDEVETQLGGGQEGTQGADGRRGAKEGGLGATSEGPLIHLRSFKIIYKL